MKFESAGVSPNTWILDNKVSQDLITAKTKNKTTFQLVPPYTHRANAAERAIQTFKAHFTAGLASVDPNFPVNEWDRLLQQAFLTLDLLRTARVNLLLSAYAYLYSNFNFNSTPLAPPGTKVVVHIKPTIDHHGEAVEKRVGTLGHPSITTDVSAAFYLQLELKLMRILLLFYLTH